MRQFALILSVLALGVAVGACGDKTITETTANGQVTTREVPNVHFAKTKFVLHAGLAYGAFHRYIYKPYKAGSFKKGVPKRKRSIAKAAAAGVFTLEQLRQMKKDAESDDKLRPLADKIGNLIPALTTLAGVLKGGGIGSAGSFGSLASQFDDIVDSAKAAGVNVPKDKAPALP